MSKQAEIIARWDSFLTKIEVRFVETLEQGRDAVLTSLDDNGYDYYSSHRTLLAIKSQIQETIIDKIDPTWVNQVEPLMKANGIDYTYIAEERNKGYNKKNELFHQLEDWTFVCDGLLSEKYYQYAQQLINKDFRCSQCGSPIQIIKDLYQSQYVNCSFCNAVNTFVPETKYVQIGWNVVNNIASYYALEEWRMIAKLQRKQNNDNYETYKNQYNAACKDYLMKYFEKRIELMPHTRATFEQDLLSALKKMTIN